MNMYLKILKAKDGDNEALKEIIKTYEIFTNIQMKKYGIRDIESCYSEVVWRIYQSIVNYKVISFESNRKIA